MNVLTSILIMEEFKKSGYINILINIFGENFSEKEIIEKYESFILELEENSKIQDYILVIAYKRTKEYFENKLKK